jgi:AcrR family transcriptional regulator
VTVTTFRRARSEEQREQRRRAILDTAAEMLAEMPVAQVSLNELSRRVGLAKSNVLRYFESREAVLLELLDTAMQDWLAHLRAELADAVDATASARERGDQLAATLAASLAAHPVLCDLFSNQAAVLEHNVSTDEAVRFKRAAIANLDVLVRLILDHMPELGERDAVRFVTAGLMMAGAAWTYACPAPAMIAVYESDPALAAMRLDFTTTLRETFEVLVAGLLARRSPA